jgi:hypothetical protein
LICATIISQAFQSKSLRQITFHKVFSVSSILHVGASAGKMCTNFIIPLPFSVSEPRPNEGNGFLIQNFTTMKGSRNVIGRARTGPSPTISVPYGLLNTIPDKPVVRAAAGYSEILYLLILLLANLSKSDN